MKKRIVATSLILSSLIVLSGCTMGEATKTNPNEPTQSDYSLSSTPQIEKLGISIDETKLPANYEVQQTSPDPENNNFVIFNRDNENCQIQTGVLFAPSYLSTWGDEYITKRQVWERLQTDDPSNIVWDKKIIKTDDGKNVEVVEASWDASGIRTGSGSGTTIVAYRAFDVLQPNGKDPQADYEAAKKSDPNIDPSLFSDKGQFGSDAKMGMPGVAVDYTCSTPDVKADPEVFKTILDSITIKGVK